jgi:hypothetical protein
MLGIEGLAPVEQLSVIGVSGMWAGVGALALYTSFAIGPPCRHPHTTNEGSPLPADVLAREIPTRDKKCKL